MHPVIESHREQLIQLCRKHHVRRLELVGSAAREEDFDPQCSDLDFIVEFEEFPRKGWNDPYFLLQDDLRELFQRRVDLMEQEGIRNPYVRRTIDQDRRLVYAA
ncbi:MAG: nucleotidyltransferase domain-containing protein [Phycisphaeraceae bacterium]